MAYYIKTVDSKWLKQRIPGFIICILFAFSILFTRLFYLQIIEGKEYRRLSVNNCIRLRYINAQRGLIFDRNSNLLVDNRPSFDLSIVLKDVKNLEETIEHLSLKLGISQSVLYKKIGKGKEQVSYKPILLKRDIGRDVLAVIKANKHVFSGLKINIRPLRHYINKQSAAHLLGYLGEIDLKELNSGKFPDSKIGDLIGKFGVEKSYEKYLKGMRGGQQVEVNASGQVVRVLKKVYAYPGHNVFLTIDADLQQQAEKLLVGKAGCIAAMDPSTGEVLALASSPAYDQNDFVVGMSHKQWDLLVSNPDRPMENKVIQAEYPPASTYKIVTAIAGLEENVIDTKTTVYCPGHYRCGDRTFRCWKRGGHGKVNVVQALSESCDVFFYQLGQKLGSERIARYSRLCGFGEITGIDLANEAKGLVPDPQWKKSRFGVSWQIGETLSIAIGQGYNLVTPIQLLVLTAAVGNGGVRYKPVIIRSIVSAEGKKIKGYSRPEPLGRLPVSKETIDIIRKGLWSVVNTRKGTGKIARIKNIFVSGKTGTAQVVSRKKNEGDPTASHLKSHAWFISYAPDVNPVISVVVMIEHGEHGSRAAAPLARDLMNSYLKKKGILGEKSEKK